MQIKILQHICNLRIDKIIHIIQNFFFWRCDINITQFFLGHPVNKPIFYLPQQFHQTTPHQWIEPQLPVTYKYTKQILLLFFNTNISSMFWTTIFSFTIIFIVYPISILVIYPIKGTCSEIFGKWIWSLFKPIHHPRWKSCISQI